MKNLLTRAFVLLLVISIMAGSAYATACTCNSCSDCTSKIMGNSCDSVTLTGDIGNTSSCIWVTSVLATHVTLDCAGHSITGPGTASPYYGIYLSSPPYMTVKNCIIRSYSTGMQIMSVSNFLLTNSTFTGNAVGLGMQGTFISTNIININSSGNSVQGIALTTGSPILNISNVLFNNITAANDGYYAMSIDLRRAWGGQIRNFTIANSAFTGSRWDDLGLTDAAPSDCASNLTLINVTGTTGYPIAYYNTNISLSNQEFSQLSLCNADNSYINNVTIFGYGPRGHFYWVMYGFQADFVDNTTFSNINTYSDGMCLAYSKNNWIYNFTGTSLAGSPSQYAILQLAMVNNTVVSGALMSLGGASPTNNTGEFVNLYNSSNNTLANILFDSVYPHLYLYISNGNSISNITINNTGSITRSFEIDRSNNNTVSNSAFTNGYSGIGMFNSTGNIFNRVNVDNNSRCIEIESASNNNRFNRVSANWSYDDTGIFVRNSTNISITNSTACWNSLRDYAFMADAHNITGSNNYGGINDSDGNTNFISSPCQASCTLPLPAPVASDTCPSCATILNDTAGSGSESSMCAGDTLHYTHDESGEYTYMQQTGRECSNNTFIYHSANQTCENVTVAATPKIESILPVVNESEPDPVMRMETSCSQTCTNQNTQSCSNSQNCYTSPSFSSCIDICGAFTSGHGFSGSCSATYMGSSMWSCHACTSTETCTNHVTQSCTQSCSSSNSYMGPPSPPRASPPPAPAVLPTFTTITVCSNTTVDTPVNYTVCQPIYNDVPKGCSPAFTDTLEFQDSPYCTGNVVASYTFDTASGRISEDIPIPPYEGNLTICVNGAPVRTINASMCGQSEFCTVDPQEITLNEGDSYSGNMSIHYFGPGATLSMGVHRYFEGNTSIPLLMPALSMAASANASPNSTASVPFTISSINCSMEEQTDTGYVCDWKWINVTANSGGASCSGALTIYMAIGDGNLTRFVELDGNNVSSNATANLTYRGPRVRRLVTGDFNLSTHMVNFTSDRPVMREASAAFVLSQLENSVSIRAVPLYGINISGYGSNSSQVSIWVRNAGLGVVANRFVFTNVTIPWEMFRLTYTPEDSVPMPVPRAGYSYDNVSHVLTVNYNLYLSPALGSNEFTMTELHSCNCSSCGECNDKLNSPLCDIVYLVNDTGSSANCIDNPENFTSKAFDCLGHSLTGDGTGNSKGIYINGKASDSILNCTVQQYERGIHIEGSPDTEIRGAMVVNSTLAGVYSYLSDNLVIANSEISLNGYSGNSPGISIDSCQYASIYNVTASLNDGNGIDLYNASHAYLANITADSNQDYGGGIYTYICDYFTAIGALLRNNSGTGIEIGSSNYANVANVDASGSVNWEGLDVYESSNGMYANMTLNNNAWVGIDAWECYNSSFYNITANGNPDSGIYVEATNWPQPAPQKYQNNVFELITAINNTNNGIFIDRNAANNTFSNVYTEGNQYGAYLSMTSYDNISQTEACANTAGGFYIDSNVNNTSGSLNHGNVTDLGGNPDFSAMDCSMPTLSLVSPANTTYFTGPIALNYAVFGGSSPISCWYGLDAGANVSLPGCSNTTLGSLANGAHTITVYANDAVNNTASDSTAFTMAVPDTTPPLVAIISPANTTYNSSTVALDYAVFDDVAIAGCWYSLDSGANTALTNCTNSTLTGLSNGAHSVSVYANDTSGNGASDSAAFSVNTSVPVSCGDGICNGNETCSSCSGDCGICADTAPPLVSIISPQNSTYNSSTVALDYTALDDVAISACWYSLDAGANISLASCANTTLSSLAEGAHTVTVYANDSSDNNASESVSFSVGVIPAPVFSGNCTLTLDGQNYSISGPVYNDTDVTLPLNVTSDGTHCWNVTCTNGSVTNVSSTWCFNIGTGASPLVAIISPVNSTYNSSAVPLNYNAIDDVAISSCWYSLDGGTNTTLASCANTTLSPLANGAHNVTVYANDTSDNLGSDTVSFSINASAGACDPSLGPDMEWNQTFGGTGYDYTWSVQQTSDGGYVLAGQTDSFGAGSSDFWLVKTDSNGTMEWNRTYGGSGYDYAWSVQQTSDGGYVLAGGTQSFGAGSDDFWLVKTDSNGTMEWNRTYGGSGSDYANSVQQTSDAGYILAGGTDSFGAGSSDFWLVKTDSSGNMLWNMTYGGPNYDYADQIQQTSDGGYVLAGGTESFGAGGGSGWVIKTDSNGTMEWNQTYDGPNEEYIGSVRQTSEGYILAGQTTPSGGDFWLIKTDRNGTMLWNKTYGGPNDEYTGSVRQTSDGGYIIGGYTYSFGAGDADFWIVKTDSNGTMEWNGTYGGLAGEWAGPARQTSDGGYIITGETDSFGAGSGDAWLIKLAPVCSLDATPPLVSILSPENSTYNSSTVNLTYTVFDDVGIDSCWYSLGGANISLANCLNITLSSLANGAHNVTVYANDTSSNVGSDTVHFSIDTSAPATCGDSVCNGGETCSTCSHDCGSCTSPPSPSGPYCGDGTCGSNENCSSCAGDCGACLPDCSANGVCNPSCTNDPDCANETNGTCTSDANCLTGQECANTTCIDCGADATCNPLCTNDPDCSGNETNGTCITNANCLTGQECANSTCIDCGEDGVCNRLCANDPDCCANDSECVGNKQCVDGTCVPPSCTANGVCNPVCQNDADCCESDKLCPSPGCARANDPDCSKIANNTGKPPSNNPPLISGQVGCQFSNPPCGDCFSCTNNQCVAINQSLWVDAPLEVPINTVIEARLLTEDQQAVKMAYLSVIDPLNSSSRYITDDKGTVYYLGDQTGYYTYSMACAELKLTRTMVTSVYDPSQPPANKKLIIPLHVTEPSRMDMQVVSLGQPVQASVGASAPNGNASNATTDTGGKYSDVLNIPGKYVFTISASNVKSLSAQINLSALPIQKSILDEPQVIVLLLLIFFAGVAAYFSRRSIVSLLARKKAAAMKQKPEAAVAGEDVTLTFLDEFGKPLSGAEVMIISDTGETIDMKADAKGRVIFIPAEAGTYRVSSKDLIIAEDKIDVK